MTNFAIVASGGNSPGMGIAFKILQSFADRNGHQLYGIQKGYDGLLTDQPLPITCCLEHLQCGRSSAFQDADKRRQAMALLNKHKIKGLFVLGGNGSSQGARKFSEENQNYPIVVLPCTIDDNIEDTLSIGVSSAVSFATSFAQALLKTGVLHDCWHILKLMGNGSYAIPYGVAKRLLEKNVHTDLIVTQDIDYSQKISPLIRQKPFGLVMVCEGKSNPCQREYALFNALKKLGITNIRLNATGHSLRGAPTSEQDVLLAKSMASHAWTLMEKAHGFPLLVTSNGRELSAIQIPHLIKQKSHDSLEKELISCGVCIA